MIKRRVAGMHPAGSAQLPAEVPQDDRGRRVRARPRRTQRDGEEQRAASGGCRPAYAGLAQQVGWAAARRSFRSPSFPSLTSSSARSTSARSTLRGTGPGQPGRPGEPEPHVLRRGSMPGRHDRRPAASSAKGPDHSAANKPASAVRVAKPQHSTTRLERTVIPSSSQLSDREVEP